MFENYPDVLSVKQLSEALCIGKNTAYDLLKNNCIHSIKIGKKYFIPKMFVIDYILAYRKKLH